MPERSQKQIDERADSSMMTINGVSPLKPKEELSQKFGLEWLNALITRVEAEKMRMDPLLPQDITDSVEELTRGVLVRCPFLGCGSEDIVQQEETYGTRTFLCNSCQGRFRVSQWGDLYFYEPGEERWIKKSTPRGIWW
jgi:hypothetical protein